MVLPPVQQLDEVGIVVGESSPTSFVFSVHPQLSSKVPRWEFVVAPLEEGLVVAQVRGVASYSTLLRKEVDYEVLSRLTQRFVEECKHWRQAHVIAYVEQGEAEASSGYTRVRYSIPPGTKVYLAPNHMLSNIYSGPGKRIVVGCLTTRPDVEIGLSVSGFRRHLAIIAQTGAGKSYLAGVLMEELLEKGATIIVLDPHADYVRLSVETGEWPSELSRKVYVYRAARSEGRILGARNIRPFSISLEDLRLQELFYITGIEENFVRIRQVVSQVFKQLKQTSQLTIDMLVNELEKISETTDRAVKDVKDSAARAVNYIEKLKDLTILGGERFDVMEVLRPRTLSVIDLSGLSDREADLVAYLVLKDVFQVKMQPEENGFRFPVFVFIEEAHRFIPPPSAGETYSSGVIKKIAAEGRKFGVFLTLVTQRPSKVHQDVLSQCNSQIIMRITNPVDQTAVVESSESLGHELMEDLPSLGRGEAVIVGEVVSIPAVVKVRKRRSAEGGADIDVERLLDESLKESEEMEKASQEWLRFKQKSEPQWSS
ncbi:MAG: ATP-binding protein [Candidatus Caldarchaeum sp.]|nr:ATP-binding protein [Candidatus Caldarchaeum sp.]